MQRESLQEVQCALIEKSSSPRYERVLEVLQVDIDSSINKTLECECYIKEVVYAQREHNKLTNEIISQLDDLQEQMDDSRDVDVSIESEKELTCLLV